VVTKGFLMFWGGIAGLVITILSGIIIVTLSVRKGKIAGEITTATEDIKIKTVKTEGVTETIPSKPILDTEFIEEKDIHESRENKLPETDIME
jgi:hypothetical protein